MEKSILLYKTDEYGREIRVMKDESELDENERTQVLSELIVKFNNAPRYTQYEFLAIINEQIKQTFEGQN